MTPTDRERVLAQVALLVLLAIAIVAQPASSVIAKPTLQWLDYGTDTWTIWSDYAATSAPDVLFVGDSRVRQDVDVTAISRDLSGGPRHKVRVSKVGISNADPALLDALIYRVLHRPNKPKTIVLGLSEFGFNANYQPDRTDDYWQLSYPPDPGFATVAMSHDPHLMRLLAGWTVPLVAHSPILAQGVQCKLHPSPACTQAAHLHTAHMTQAERDLIIDYFVNLYLLDFQWSPTELRYLASTAEEIRAAGVRLAFVILPINGIAEIFPTLYSDYLIRMHAIASGQHTPLTDMHATVTESDWSLWVDPSHLNDNGATSIAPQLATVAAGAV